MSEEELIETLKAFEKNRVEQLKEPARNLFYAIMKIADERDLYKNIIKEVKEYIEEHTTYENYGYIDELQLINLDFDIKELKGILDKESK